MADIVVSNDAGVQAIVSPAVTTNVIIDGTLRGVPGLPGLPGTPGSPGLPGATGAGVPTGGTTGQLLTKNSSTNYDTAWSNFVISNGAVIHTVTQNAHGFTVGQVVYFNGTSFVLSKADTKYDAEVTGIVSAVADANDFTLCTEGYLGNLAGLAVGAIYYLSPTTAGALTITEPSTIGQVSKPVLTADTPSSGYFHNYRGMVIT